MSGGRETRTERLACGNVDSCEPGTTHLFPCEGEQVRVREACAVREVSTDWPRVELEAREVLTVDEAWPESHEVLAFAHGVRVWVALDDLTASQ